MAYSWQHQSAISVYNPVDYGLTREMYSGYGTKAQAVPHMPDLSSKSAAGQIESSTTSEHPTRLATTHAGTMPMTPANLDRWLSSVDNVGLGQSLYATHASDPSHEQPVTASISPEQFYGQKLVKPGGSQSMWSKYHGLSIPPPPPGPPPTDSTPARMHSVIREIAVPPLEHGRATAHSVPTLLPLSFRQPARSQAPLPLKDRGMAHAAPKVPSYHLPLRRDVVPHPITAPSPPMHRRKKPSAIDIGLAGGSQGLQDYRSVLTAPMRDTSSDGSSGVPGARHGLTTHHHYPKTAVFPPSKSPGPWASSPIRGVALSPLDTDNTHDSRSSVVVDFILSPSLVPDVSKHKSPISRSSQSSPSLWSPQTPRAMSFDNVVLVQDSTPPLPTLEWLNERPQTIIEEEIQDETPMEVDPPRGRIGDHHDVSAADRQSRARSCSPPPSAYPKESAFSWEEVDVGSRSATDDDLYCLTPVFTRPVVDSVKYKPTNSVFDVRQTILGCYFKC